MEKNYILILVVIAVCLIMALLLSKLIANNCQKKMNNITKDYFIKADMGTQLIEALKNIDNLSKLIKHNDVQGIYYSVTNVNNLRNMKWIHNYVEFKESEDKYLYLEEKKEKLNNLQIEYINIRFDKYYVEHLNKEVAQIIEEKWFYDILSNSLENYNNFISFCRDYLEDRFNDKLVITKPELKELHEKMVIEKHVYDLVLINYEEYKKYYEGDKNIQRLNKIIKFCKLN